jgi:hypothetical protein
MRGVRQGFNPYGRQRCCSSECCPKRQKADPPPQTPPKTWQQQMIELRRQGMTFHEALATITG